MLSTAATVSSSLVVKCHLLVTAGGLIKNCWIFSETFKYSDMSNGSLIMVTFQVLGEVRDTADFGASIWDGNYSSPLIVGYFVIFHWNIEVNPKKKQNQKQN